MRILQSMKELGFDSFRWRISAGMALLLAGCAHFEPQTSELEPHGLVTVVKPLEYAGEAGVVKKLDGLAVRTGQTYRVRPGMHTVVVQFVDTGVETSKPVTLFGVGTAPKERAADMHVSESGKMTVTGQQPFSGMQPATLSVETRRTRFITNSLSVQAGWRYELDGDRVTTARFLAP